jgi:predicted acylesterase/phospholipase RssA
VTIDVAPKPPVFDCVILSGGGSKGAYGAGAAKALAVYRSLRAIDRPICYIGTSAGALNAAVLAADGADALIAFWLRVTPKSILGVRILNRKFRAGISYLSRILHPSRPFHLYPQTSLRRLLEAHIKLERLSDAHLIIPATNFSAGRLEAFYVSTLVDKFKAHDDALLLMKERRLMHLTRVETQAELVRVLVASSSYPIFFPPVQVSGSWYVDGGVGNHTPTREAAYFYRFLEELGLGASGEVFCIKQDPPRTLEQGSEAMTLGRLLQRTLDVYHHVHTEPIVRAWFRINSEMTRLQERVNAFSEWLDTQAVDEGVRAEIKKKVRTEWRA